MIVLIRTRSGRYINAYHAIAFSIEETRIEIEGKRERVYNLVAHLSQPLLPAILGIYASEESAQEALKNLVNNLSKGEKIVEVESQF
ncbi:hypothetical protein [Thermocrinis sp.]